eukprot:5032801-Amphidinium_carterae.1
MKEEFCWSHGLLASLSCLTLQEEAQQDAGNSAAESAAQQVAVEAQEESLAHFVASEFAEFEPHQQPLRQRRAAKDTQPGVTRSFKRACRRNGVEVQGAS